MKFLCLIYEQEQKPDGQSKDERLASKALMAEYNAFTESIRKSGQYLSGEALHSVRTARTVRVRNGKSTAIDGPFAETKEQLGGYFLIEAPNLDDALKVAERIPAARSGSVEVRPVVDFSRPQA